MRFRVEIIFSEWKGHGYEYKRFVKNVEAFNMHKAEEEARKRISREDGIHNQPLHTFVMKADHHYP